MPYETNPLYKPVNRMNREIARTPDERRSLLFRLFHSPQFRRGATVVAIALALAALAAALDIL